MNRGKKNNRDMLPRSSDGTPPPCSLVSEELAIAALVSPGVIPVDEIANKLRAEYFTSANRVKIFEAWMSLYKEGEDCSAPSVVAKLARTGSPQIGLGDLYGDWRSANAPEPKNFAAAVKELSRTYRLRKAAAIYQLALAETYHGEEVDPVALALRVSREVVEACDAADADNGSMKDLFKAEAVRLRDGISDVIDIKTGFDFIDESMGGICAGDLVVIGGRPGGGKSVLGLNIAQGVLETGKGAAVFSLEMDPRQLLHRIVAGMCRVNLLDYRKGNLTQQQKDIACGYVLGLAKKPWTVRGGKLSALDIRQQSIEFKKELAGKSIELGCVVVDYLQLLATPVKAERRDLDIAESTRELKLLAQELGCPIVLLSQLNRSSANASERPTMSNLRESGAIEQDADSVILIHQTEDGIADRDAEIIVAKNRSGPTGKHKLRFIPSQTRFENKGDEVYRVGGFNEMGRR